MILSNNAIILKKRDSTWQALIDTPKMKKDEKVLIRADSSRAGSFAIQLTKARRPHNHPVFEIPEVPHPQLIDFLTHDCLMNCLMILSCLSCLEVSNP